MADPIITEYQYRPLPPEVASDWYLWIVKVTPYDHTGDTWTVLSMFQWLGSNNQWTWPRENAGRWPLAEALTRADAAQWTLEVNRLTAQDILNRSESGDDTLI